MNHLAGIALGGACGALARFLFSQWVSTLWPGRFPVATLLLNGLGCAAAGVVYVVIVERQLLGPHWQAMLMSGFLGAFTTFSAFSVETIVLFEAGRAGLALLYVVASTASSVLLAGVAVQVTRLALS